MNVLHINTYERRGGASIAGQRIIEALQKHSPTKARFLVDAAVQNNEHIQGLSQTYIQKKLSFARFALERLYYLPYEVSRQERFYYSPARFGRDISRHPWVQEADILHLHWINFGFLSLESLKKLLALKKPIVWTLHDMWAFTGGCHHARHCPHYQKACGNCFYMKKPKEKDLSFYHLKKKLEIFSGARISFVGCSQWMRAELAKSKLIQANPQIRQYNIPNPLDTQIFKPLEKLRQGGARFSILFGSPKITDEKKGYSYFIKALQLIKEKYPDMAAISEVHLIGNSPIPLEDSIPLPFRELGYISRTEEMVKVYNQAQVFVLPSLNENLPNTIMESMACLTPVVAFNIGGIPEMIDHKINGYLADYLSAESLADGLYWIWQNYKNQEQWAQVQQAARNKVLENYAESKVAAQYNEVYQESIQDHQ